MGLALSLSFSLARRIWICDGFVLYLQWSIDAWDRRLHDCIEMCMLVNTSHIQPHGMSVHFSMKETHAYMHMRWVAGDMHLHMYGVCASDRQWGPWPLFFSASNHFSGYTAYRLGVIYNDRDMKLSLPLMLRRDRLYCEHICMSVLCSTLLLCVWAVAVIMCVFGRERETGFLITALRRYDARWRIMTRSACSTCLMVSMCVAMWSICIVTIKRLKIVSFSTTS
jgi:hypothetical protein